MNHTPQFPTYDHYRDSGIPWIGKIPTHWNVSSIRAVTELKSEKNQPDLPVLSVYREFGVILKDSRDDNHNATSLDTSAYKVVKKGDLVVNKMKAWQGSMGVSEYEGIVSPAYIICRVKQDKMLPKYLHYLLRSQPLIGVYNAISYGVRVGQWDMHYEDFKKVAIAEPPLAEMERIVSFIDQKTAEIDAAIAKKQQLIQLLNEQKAILINRAVTKGLNPNVKMKDSGVAWIGEIPEHWEITKNRYLFMESNIRSKDGTELHLSMSQKFGLIPSDSLIEKTLQSESYEGAKLCLQGDLVLNRLKAHLSVFATALCDGLVSPDYSVFRLKNTDHQPVYFEQLFKTPLYLGEFNKKVKGIVVGFLRLYSDDFNSIPSITPPTEEQSNIVEWIYGLNAVTKEAIELEEEAIRKLKEFKQVLISGVTTGKIRV